MGSVRKTGSSRKDIITILEKIYGRAKAYVKMDRKGTTFKVMNGMKQGDPISSSIFNNVPWKRSSGNQIGRKRE